MPEKNKSVGARFLDGLWGSNPLLRLGLGLCPAIAVTTNGMNAFVIAAATVAVLVCASLIISIIQKLLVDPLRVPVYMVVCAALATAAQMVMRVYCPAVNAELGMFVPLIAVNTLLLTRADALTGPMDPAGALADAIGMGLGYICAMTLLGCIREMMSFGTVFGKMVLDAGFEGSALALLPVGGFLLLGLMMGIFNLFIGKGHDGKEDRAQ